MAAARPIAALSSAQLREAFTSYFTRHGHTRVASSSLVPDRDPSLLFTNAGMVQFKDYFDGSRPAPFPTAVSVQNCMRAGGKHNDLDNVGFTPRHHTFFEMLGNFSFGDYFKEQAIKYAWEFLTVELRLPADRLRVSVLHGDTETYDLWTRISSLPPPQITYLGPDDNFWSMGTGSGPCGPCTEIYYDLGPLAATPADRWLEIWNLVFMQHASHPDGSLSPLSRPCVDTGMGLERVAAVLQGKSTNYETDTFTILTNGVLSLLANDTDRAKAHLNMPHVRIIADHVRAAVHLIGDGVTPGSTGRPYVLRRILRRAINAGLQLGFTTPFLAHMVPFVLSVASPESRVLLAAKQGMISAVLEREEIAFGENLLRGLALLDDVAGKGMGKVGAHEAFRLYDTYGFPMDLVGVVARERGWKVDAEGAERLLERQRERSREEWVRAGGGGKEEDFFKGTMDWQSRGIFTTFDGYGDEVRHSSQAAVRAIHVVDPSDASRGAFLALDRSPFYGRAGGQVGDTGIITSDSGEVFVVSDTIRPFEGGVAVHVVPSGHVGDVEKDVNNGHVDNSKSSSSSGKSASKATLKATSPSNETVSSHVTNHVATSSTTSNHVDNNSSDIWREIRPGASVQCQVDYDRRRAIRAHHTATHLLNAALRSVLGDHVAQAGSHVDASRLRFDFTCSSRPTPEQLAAIEAHVQAAVAAADPVETIESALESALESGAVALFSERYGSRVRSVRVGKSLELCGGTHARSSAELSPFIVIGESAVAAGVRRIEAVAGPAAIAHLVQSRRTLLAACAKLKASPDDVIDRIDSALESRKSAALRLSNVLRELSSAPSLGHSVVGVHSTVTASVPVQLHLLADDIFDAEFCRQRAVALSEMAPTRVHVVVCGRRLVAAVDEGTFPDVHAGRMLAGLAGVLGGKAGGRGDVAQGMAGEEYKSGKRAFHPAVLQWANLS